MRVAMKRLCPWQLEPTIAGVEVQSGNLGHPIFRAARLSRQGRPFDMTRALKAGFVAVAGAALVFACTTPAWAQRGGARGGGGASHGFGHSSGGFGSGSRGFGSASLASGARAPMVRTASRKAAPARGTSAARSFVRTRSSNSTRVVTNRPWRDHNGRLHRGRSIVFLGGYPGYYDYPYDYGFDFGDNNASYDATQQADYSQQPEQYADEQPAPAPVQYAAPAVAAPVADVGEFI